MHILLYYVFPFTFICCCFYGMIEEKYSSYKLRKISDDLIEIDNCDIILDSVRATSLEHNTSNIYELNDNNHYNNNNNNGVVPLIPLDNIIIQE